MRILKCLFGKKETPMCECDLSFYEQERLLIEAYKNHLLLGGSVTLVENKKIRERVVETKPTTNIFRPLLIESKDKLVGLSEAKLENLNVLLLSGESIGGKVKVELDTNQAKSICNYWVRWEKGTMRYKIVNSLLLQSKTNFIKDVQSVLDRDKGPETLDRDIPKLDVQKELRDNKYLFSSNNLLLFNTLKALK